MNKYHKNLRWRRNLSYILKCNLSQTKCNLIFFPYCFLNLFIIIRSCSVSQAGLGFRIALSLPPCQLGLQVRTITLFCPSNTYLTFPPSGRMLCIITLGQVNPSPSTLSEGWVWEERLSFPQTELRVFPEAPASWVSWLLFSLPTHCRQSVICLLIQMMGYACLHIFNHMHMTVACFSLADSEEATNLSKNPLPCQGV